MKKSVLMSIVALGFSVSAFGTSCFTSTPLADYLPGGSSPGGCTFASGSQSYTIDNFVFALANISLLAGGNAPTAGDIMVTATIGANGPTVTFTPDSGIDATGLVASLTYLFGFEIDSDAPTIGVTSVTLDESSTVTGLSTGLIGEEDCFGGVLPTSNLLGLSLPLGNSSLACTGGGPAAGLNLNLTPLLNASANALIELEPATASVDVLKEVQLTSLVLGSASVNSIGQTFTTGALAGGSAAPEPASYFLGGCGLIALALFRPRGKIKTDD